MVNLIMSGQYFSLETVISGIYAKFPIRIMLSPNSSLDVRMDFSLPECSLDYSYFRFLGPPQVGYKLHVTCYKFHVNKQVIAVGIQVTPVEIQS